MEVSLKKEVWSWSEIEVKLKKGLLLSSKTEVWLLKKGVWSLNEVWLLKKKVWPSNEAKKGVW